jgi:hypothetical protein
MSTSSGLSVTLFVEGSSQDSSRDIEDKVAELWRVRLPTLMKCPSPDRVVGISKGHLQAMQRPWRDGEEVTSSVRIPLDEFIEIERGQHPFDAALVAWDLVPPWDRERRPERCLEVRDFYRCLSESQHLPQQFRDMAAGRMAEIQAQPPGVCPKLKQGMIAAICMVPEFEAVLADEQAVREALDVRGKDIPRWPNWDPDDPKETLDKAIRAARRFRPQPKPTKQVPGNMETRPNDWHLFFSGQPRMQEVIKGNAIVQRYAKWLR